MSPKYHGTPLDMLEASTISNSLPAMYAHIILQHELDVHRLYTALYKCNTIVPELFTRYDPIKNIFYPCHVDIHSLIEHPDQFSYDHWNLQHGPQVNIQIIKEQQQSHMCIALSHIVSDGSGFKQFLTMLCAFYNNETFDVINHRNVKRSFLVPSIKLAKTGATYPIKLQSKSDNAHRYITHHTTSINALSSYAHKHNLTVNDLLLYSYVMALYDVTKINSMSIPCPVDLRKYLRHQNPCSITNFTGGYNITLQNIAQTTPMNLLKTIHEQMLYNRKENRDLKNINYLYNAYQCLPKPICRFFVKRWYREYDVSFTNVGICDHNAIHFQGSELLDFYISTRFREFPSYQVCISTFQDTLHLTSSGCGNDESEQLSDQILRSMLHYLSTLPNV